MVQRFEETGHPVFTGASSALNRGVMKGKEQERHHPLQWGIFQHRASISNQSLSKSGLFLRGSHRLVSVDAKFEFTNTEKCGRSRSEFICEGIRETACTWKQVARRTSRLPVTATRQIQFKQVCEKAGVYRQVERENYYKTVAVGDDGPIPMGREYTTLFSNGRQFHMCCSNSWWDRARTRPQ